MHGPSRRQFILGASALSMAALPEILVACGGSGGGSAQTVELNYWYPVGVAGPLAKIMASLVNDFNAAHPHIRVKPSFTGSYLDTNAKIDTAIQGGNPPDVAVANATELQPFLDLNGLTAVGDLAAANPGGYDASDIPAPFEADTQSGGKTWSVPFQRSTPIMYYNKTAMARAGLDPNRPPQTWDELVRTSQAIMKAGATEWGVEIPSGGASGSAYWVFQPLAIQAGQNLNGKDPAHVSFDSPQAIKALSFLVGLSQTEKVQPPGTVDWTTAPTDFAAGKVAFLYHSTGSLVSILQQAKFEVGTAFCPKDQQFGVPTGGGNLYVFKGIPQDRQQAAWTFVQWMTAPAQAARWSVQTGYVPVRKAALQTSTWKRYIARVPQAQTAIDQLNYAQRELSGHQSSHLQQIMDDAIGAAVTGQQSPQAALEQAQRQADGILQRYR